MATSNTTLPTIYPEDEELLSQLASLQDMYNQILHLRTLPQAVMSPVSEILRGQSLHSIGLDGPSKLYARIQKIAIDGLKDVETFKQSWSNHESQELWKRTLNEPYPQGTNVWRTNYILALKDHKDQKQHQTLDMETFPADARNVKDIIQDFQAQHATIKLEAPNSAALLPFNITVAGMSFRVISNYQSSRGEYEVQYDPKSKPTQLQDGILSCLNQRLVKSNLEYLLNMIASYEDVKRRPCDKCLRLFDTKLTFPVVRNQFPSPSQEGENPVHWEALHVDCT